MFWNLFIHPDAKADEILYLKSKIISGLLLVYICITVFNSVFFRNYGMLLVYNNITGVVMAVVALLVLRFSSKFFLTAIIFSIVAMANIITSMWITGGIHSVDIFWFMILSISCTLFLNKNVGLLLSFGSMMAITGYYIIERMGIRNFLQIRMQHDITEDYINVMVVFSFSAFIHYFFSDSDQLRSKRESLNQQLANDLQTTYQFLATHVNEIIGVHNQDLSFVYVSPFIQKALGYTEEEVIGSFYNFYLVDSSSLIQSDITKETTSIVQLYHKNGNKIWLKILLMPVFHQDGSFDRFISTSRDVTVEIENDFKLAQIREQIARDFHDEMGNKLASITLNSNVLKTLIVDGDAKVLETVRRIEKNSTSLYHNSRDFIWSINSKSDNLLELFAYIKDFAEELLYTSDCNLKVDAQNLKDIDLPITYSRHIVLLLKEAFTNAYKYSHAQNIGLKFSLEGELLTIQLNDNGIGFDFNTIKAGNGLYNMHERARKINATLSIKSIVDRGTNILLHINI